MVLDVAVGFWSRLDLHPRGGTCRPWLLTLAPPGPRKQLQCFPLHDPQVIPVTLSKRSPERMMQDDKPGEGQGWHRSQKHNRHRE